MRLLTVVGIAILLCGAASAQTCISYVPNPATFPFPLPITTQVNFTFTNPNGTVTTNNYSVSGTILFPSPRDQATAVFGASSGSLFQACNNAFPSNNGTVTLQDTSVPQKWLINLTVTSSGGSMSINEDVVNTVINADGACPINCSLDNLHSVYLYQYNIATGAYTISFQGSRHFIGVDPATGIKWEQVTQTQQSLSGVWPLLQSPGTVSKFITIDYPGATLTAVRQINNHGVMAGRYILNGAIHAFILQNGTFTTIDVPGSPSTAAWGINDNGDVVGRYFDPALNRDHGFLYHNGAFTTIDPPGTVETFALGINNVGQIVGYYDDTSGIEHGFLLSGGVYTTIDYPGSPFTDIYKINNTGAMAVSSYDGSLNSRGFLYQNGVFSPIDYPGAADTEALGINDGGQIVGDYFDGTTFAQLGFELGNGSYSSVSVPGSTATIVEDLNDTGQLAGQYTDTAGMVHGFVSVQGPLVYATTSPNTLTVIDSSSNLFVGQITVGTGVVGVAVNPTQTRVYVTSAENGLSAIDAATGSVVATTPLGGFPVDLALSPDGAHAYVVNATGSVQVVNTSANTVSANIPVANSSSSIAITPNGAFAYVGNAQAGSIPVSLIDLSTNTVVQSIDAGPNAVDVAVTPNGAFAYVANDLAVGGTVTVLDTSTNAVIATIPVGNGPSQLAITPDSGFVYVTNYASSTVSVIATASNRVVATIPVGAFPGSVAITPDGAFAYVGSGEPVAAGGTGSSVVSVIQTSSNTVIATLPSALIIARLAIGSTPPTTQKITQPLSPTAPNQFNFGTHNFNVQFPPGTSFSGVNMTVAAAQTTQTSFKQSVAGSAFPNASCIVYSGSGGNCVNYQISCSDMSGNPIPCPSEPTPSINVKTSYDTVQSIINPGFLRRPTGSTQWENIFTEFLAQRVDPTTKGKTTGFSDFVAVDLGASNTQGVGSLQMGSPLRPADRRVFARGTEINIRFQLTSIANPGTYISDAEAGLSIVMIADAKGNAVSREKLVLPAPAFHYSSSRHSYSRQLELEGYPPGTYALTIYGNAFAAQQVLFTVK